ncbi:hypothetical protein QA640_42655 [Bradyrhizobium sp. CB82]|uniref:hypothetical protein n=1 Tax=Bradyrhizobium sp. CB82 TaxID=3039159 RepID=UPI0024B0BD52|nr:hypothetical protein [Bradyrhizobium sp. CB82]WFU40785.1 hypothetical protein QA640_42655 [Bradyrhizobium sp. CB82]
MAGVGDAPEQASLQFSPSTIFLRAFDGLEVALAGEVLLTGPRRSISPKSGRGAPFEGGHALTGPRAGWRPAGGATAESPDGRYVAELMELLAIDRKSAPAWLMSAIGQALVSLRENKLLRTFYAALLAQGVATSVSVGQWGTCDFDEWRFRGHARPIDRYVRKLFAIKCTTRAAAPNAELAAPSNLSDMCHTVIPSAYFVCVRNSSVQKRGDGLDVDVEVEAGHVPPADWIPKERRSTARFEIEPPGASSRSTLVVPSGQRSSTQRLHFNTHIKKGQAHITVLDEHKRRYDLPIDLA